MSSAASREKPGEKKLEPLLRIFLSHKSKDAARAAELKMALERYGAGRLTVFVSGKSIQVGQQWAPQLVSNLAMADILILLYSPSVENWDWCLYEGGFFVGSHERELAGEGGKGCRDRLICLHHPDLTLPQPLQSWQALPATDERIRAFLREIFGGTSDVPGVNPYLVNDEGMREDFDRLVQQVIKTAPADAPAIHKFTHEIALRLSPQGMADLKVQYQMPPRAILETQRDTLREVFGLAADQETVELEWSDFIHALVADPEKEPQRMWAENLAYAIAKLNDKQVDTPLLPILGRKCGPGGDQYVTYRPIILERTRQAEQWTRFQIVLARTPDTLAIHNDMDRLFYGMMQLRHSYWVVFPAAKRKLRMAKAPGYEEHAEEYFREILSEIRASRIEAANRGIQVSEDVYDLFERKDHPTLGDLIQAWRGLVERLQAAASTRDIPGAQSAIDELARLTGNFLRRYADRFAEKLHQEIPD